MKARVRITPIDSLALVAYSWVVFWIWFLSEKTSWDYDIYSILAGVVLGTIITRWWVDRKVYT